MKQKEKKIICLTSIILCSLLWLGFQILLWTFNMGYYTWGRKIIELLGPPAMNLDSEWRRFVSVLTYLQTLPHVLLAYCLFTKWPGKKNGVRILSVVIVFFLSLLAIPRVAVTLFPNFRIILSPNNQNHLWVLLIHGLAGILGALAAFAADTVIVLKEKRRSLFQPRAIGYSVARYAITLLISLLIAVCYGFVLGILDHFSHSAVTLVLRSFSPDARLISGIITMCIMAPLVEEIAFRGLIMTKVRQYSSTWFAVIFSSILFGLWHQNLGQFFATTVMGIAFSWIYLKTGKLRFAMLAHCLSNALLALSLSKGDGYLPKVGLLTGLRTALLDVSVPVGIIGLIVTMSLIALLIYKGYPRFSEENL